MTITHPPHVFSSSSLVGTSVRNLDKQDIGTIKDLMIDLKTGTIQYAVLSFGGVMGFGEKLFAVPFGAFRLDTGDEVLILDARKEILEIAQGFDPDHWPNFADPAFHESVHSAYKALLPNRA